MPGLLLPQIVLHFSVRIVYRAAQMIRTKEWSRGIACGTERQRIADAAKTFHTKPAYYYLLILKMTEHERCMRVCMSIAEIHYVSGINEKSIRRLIAMAEYLGHIKKTGQFGGVSHQIPEYEFCYDETMAAPTQHTLRLIDGGAS